MADSSSSTTTTSSTHILILGATGRVGQHVVGELLRRLQQQEEAAGSNDGGGDGRRRRTLVTLHAATRDPTSAAAQSLLRRFSAAPSTTPSVALELLPLDLAAASTDELEAACHGKQLLFLALPQAFTPHEMAQCQAHLAAALTRTKTHCLVKLSSFGIDEHSSRCVVTQGPLGEAHTQGEAALRTAALPLLVSLRPSSFFANFDAYDLPGLAAGGRCLRSPLGPDARVNWVSVEDIGALAAALLLRALGAMDEGGGEPVFEAVDVLGPPENTLSGPEMAALVTRALLHQHQQNDTTKNNDGGKEEAAIEQRACVVRYEETPLPPDAAYGPLWAFLRAGGFDASVEADAPLWRELVGRPPRTMEEHVRAALLKGV